MIQIVEMSELEKYEMYMKLKKSELVKMLIECNRQLDRVFPIVNDVDSICPNGYVPNDKSTALECIYCGRGKYAH